MTRFDDSVAWRPARAVLEGAGFTARDDCYVRDVGPVRQIVEPQRAVYAPRITLNLGLALEPLSPFLPWISARRTSLMAEAQRWTRLGRIRGDGQDRWWSLEPNPTSAGKELGQELTEQGLPWLARESTPDAFMRFAEQRRARACSELNPEGGFGELRLSIAIRCWRCEVEEARRLLPFAESAWRVEHGRLEHARRDFGESQDLDVLLEPVPDLWDELVALVEASDRPSR